MEENGRSATTKGGMYGLGMVGSNTSHLDEGDQRLEGWKSPGSNRTLGLTPKCKQSDRECRAEAYPARVLPSESNGAHRPGSNPPNPMTRIQPPNTWGINWKIIFSVKTCTPSGLELSYQAHRLLRECRQNSIVNTSTKFVGFWKVLCRKRTHRCGIE